MVLDVSALVATALRTARTIGVAAPVTISDGTASFSITAVRDDTTAAAPPSGGNTPASAPTFTVAAQDCGFVPADGHTLTTADGHVFRVLAVLLVAPTSVPLAYTIQVAG